MPEQPELSVVVPTYNERERLADLVSEARRVFLDHRVPVEIIVVDDNSPDGTGAIADRLAADGQVRVVHRASKLGLGSAVMEGFATARGRVLGVMDADLSHPPSAFPAMLAAMRELGVDAVVGSRYIAGGGCRNWPLRRRVLSRAGCLLARPLTPVRDVTSGLFLIRPAAIENVRLSATGFKICLELLVRGRVASIAEVPYVFVDRAAGESKMTSREALGYFVQLKDLYLLRLATRPQAAPRYQSLTVHQLEQLLRR